jgi:hypothetical protein
MNVLAATDSELSKDAWEMLNLWQACGLSKVIEHAEGLEPVLMYLRNSPRQKLTDGFCLNRRMSYFELLQAGLSRSARQNLAKGDAQSCMWLYRYFAPEMRLQLIRSSMLSLEADVAYKPSIYCPDHSNFKTHNATWDKYCTLLALEGFPTELSYSSIRATHWLTSYETLSLKFPNLPILDKMRRSLLKLGNQGHIDFLRVGGRPIQNLKPKTAGARKYMSLIGLDRIALMRHHAYCTHGSL